MGILADIYSGGNTLKRRVNALIKDPAGTLGLGVTRFGEDQNQLINLMRNAYPMAGEKTVLNSPQQVAQFRGELADKSADQAMAAATVWHGSPHKFDKFDSSKIGTGEGAQAYGHGLYLAESQDVAGEYARMNITGPGQVAHIGKKNGPDGAMQALKNAYPKMPKQWYESAIAKADDAGNTYKVDLPDEHIAKMLDWDKPLSQQAPEVQALLPAVGSATRGKVYDWKKSLPMGDAYRQMVGDIGGEAKAAEALRQAGIPGIRYLDGGSRGAGGGTSNFVVFPGNESMLSIMERNGQPILNKLLGK